MVSKDDASVQLDPTIHVDYLSYGWAAEDVAASWRYISSNAAGYETGVRLQNAAWRSWGKLMAGGQTVDVEAIGWLKDCDITWLYGPLQRTPSQSSSSTSSRSTSPSSNSSSQLAIQPCLRQRTRSEIMLSGSQFSNPSANRLHTVSPNSSHRHPERLSISSDSKVISGSTYPRRQPRNVRFHSQVERCIAIQCSSSTFDADDRFTLTTPYSQPRSQTQPKLIEKLPSITLDSYLAENTPKTVTTAASVGIPFYLRITPISTPLSHDINLTLEPDDDDADFDWLSNDTLESHASPPTSIRSSSPCEPTPRTQSPPSPSSTTTTKSCCSCHFPMPVVIPTSIPFSLESHSPTQHPSPTICAECIRSLLIALEIDTDDWEYSDGFSVPEDGLSFSHRLSTFSSSY